MDKWEYKVLRPKLLSDYSDHEKLLNELGEQGWELVCVHSELHCLYLKRKVNS